MIADKASVTIRAEYMDFTDIFSKKFVIILLEHLKINIYIIHLEENKQSPYKSIYSVGLIKLETFLDNKYLNLLLSLIFIN